MANRYWVGGSGVWSASATLYWSTTPGGTGGASVPTSADSVFFDQAGTYSVTITGAVNCLNITVSAGSVTFLSSSTPSITIYGSMNLIAGTVWDTQCDVTFSSAVAGNTINTNGTTISAQVLFSTSAPTVASWTLNNELTLASSYSVQLISGALNLGGFNITCSRFISTGSLARSIAFGTNNITLTSTASEVVISMADISNFTYTGTGGFIKSNGPTGTYSMGQSLGGGISNAPNLSFSGTGTGSLTLSNGCWINKLDFGSTTPTISTTSTINVNSLTLSSSGSFSVLTVIMVGSTGTLIGNGNNTLNSLLITAANVTLGGDFDIATRTVTLNSGTLNLNNFNLSCGFFSSSNSAVRTVNFGTGNIILNSGATASAVVAMSTATNFTWTGTGGFQSDCSVTRAYEFGSAAGGSRTNSPNLTFTGSGTAVATFTTGSWFNNVDFGTTAFTIGTTSLNFNGLILGNGNYINLTANMVGTGTLASNGSTNLGVLNISAQAAGQTTTLGSNFTVTTNSTVTLNAGTLALNGYNLTCGIFNSNNSSTRSINFGTGNIVLAHTTAASTVLAMQTATGFTVSGTGGFQAAADVARVYSFGITAGGSITNSPNLTFTGSGTAVQTITTAGWFNRVNFGTTAFNPGTTTLNLNSLTLSSGGTFTTFTPNMVGSGTIVSNGNATLAVLTINNTASGTTTLGGAFSLAPTGVTTLTTGSIALNGFDLTTGTFVSSGTGVRSVAFGTNSIVLAHTTAATTVLSMPTATNFSWTGTGGFSASAAVTRTYNFGATAGGTAINAPRVTLTGTGTAVQTFTTASWFDLLNFGTTAFTVPATTLNIDSLTLSTSGTFTNLSATMVGTGTITPNGKSIAAFTVNSLLGSTTLAGALACTTYTQTSGTIDFANFNLTCSSTATYTAGTLNNIGVINCTTWTCAGTFTLSQGTITPSVSFVVTGGFNYTTGTLSAVPTFTHTSGSVTFSKAYSLTATGTYTLTAGALTLTGVDLTTGIFSSPATGVRTIDYGSSSIILAHTTAATTVLNIPDLTNLTCTGTGGFTANASITRTYVSNGTNNVTTNQFVIQQIAPNLTITSGAATQTLSHTNTNGSCYKNLDFTGSTCTVNARTYVNTLTLSSGGTYTGFIPIFTRTQTWTAQFSKQLGGIGVGSDTATLTLDGTQTYTTTSVLYLMAGTLDLGGYDLTIGRHDSLTSTDPKIIAFGNNWINLVFPTQVTVVSFNYGATISWTGTGGFRTDASVIRDFNFFSVSGGASSRAFNLEFTGTGSAAPTFQGTNGWAKNLDFGTTTFALSASIIVSGDLTLSASGTYTAANFSLGNGTVITRGRPIGTTSVIAGTGTTTLGDALTTGVNNAFTLTSGTLNLNGFNLTCGRFVSDNANTRSIAFGSNNITLTHTTAATNVLQCQDFTGFSWTGTGGFVADCSVSRNYIWNNTSTGNDGSTAYYNVSNVAAVNLTLTGSGTAEATFGQGAVTPSFNNLNFGTTAFTVALASSVRVNNVTLSASGTYTNLTLLMGAPGAITSSMLNGKQLGGFGIIHSGTTTLEVALSLTATSAISVFSGTLNLGGFDLTCGIFNSTTAAANVRSVAFDTNSITLAHPTAATTVLNITNGTGFTFTGTGGFVSNASVTRTYTVSAGTGANSPNVTLTGSGTAIQTFTSTSWFNKIDFGTTAFALPTASLNCNNIVLSTGGTFTGLTLITKATGTIRTNAKPIVSLNIDAGSTGTTTLLDQLSYTLATATTTLTSGTFDLGGFNLTTGVFSSSNSNTRSIAFGTNSILLSTTTAAATNLAMATITGFSWTGTGGFQAAADITRTFTCGSTAGGSSTNAPNLTFINSGTAILTITSGSWFNKLDFGTTGFILPATTLNLNSLTLSSGPTVGVTSNLTAVMVGTGTIVNPSNRNLAALTINCPGGSTTLSGSLTIGNTATCTLTAGNLNLNNNNLTVGIFNSSNTNIRSITFAGGVINLIHTTATTTVLDMAVVNNFTCDRGTSYGFVTDTATTRTVRFGTTSGASSSNAPDIRFYFAALNSVITIASNSWFNKLDFGDTNFTVPAATVNINSLILSIPGIYTSLNVNMVGTGTLMCPTGKTLGTLTIANGSGTTGLEVYSQVAATTVNFTSGNFDFGGSGSVTCTGTFTYAGTSILNFGAGASINTGTFTLNTPGTFTLSQGTLTTTVAFILTAGTFVYSSGTWNGTTTSTTLTQNSGTFTLEAALTLPSNMSYTLTAGTLNLDGFNLTVGAFISNNANARTVNWGTSSIILNHTVAATAVLSMSTITNYSYTGTQNFVSDAAVTRTITYGITGGSITNSPNLTLTGTGASVVTITTGSWFNVLNFGPTTYTSNTTNLNLNSLILGAGTYTPLTATMLGTGTINGNGKSVGPLVINSGSGTTTLVAALGCTTATYTSGTIDFAGFNLTGTGAATYTAGTLNNISTITCTTWNSAGTFALSQGTLTCTTFSLTGTFNYSGGTLNANTFTHTSGTTNLSASLTLPVTSTYSLALGALNLNDFNLSCGIFNSTTSTARSVAFGSGNIVLTHTTAATTVLEMSTLTGFSWTGTGRFQSDASITRTYNSGITAGGSIVTAPNLALTGSGTAVQTFTTAGWFNKLDLGTTGHTSAVTSLSLESLTLGVGSYGNLTANIVGTGTLVNNGALVGPILVVNSGSNTTTLGSNFLCSTYTQTQGIVDFAGYNLTSTTSVTYSNGSLLNIGTISSPAWTVSGNLVQDEGTFTATASFTLASGSYTYNDGTFTPTPAFLHNGGAFNVNKAITTTTVGGTHTFNDGLLMLNGVDLTCGSWVLTGGSRECFISFGENNIIVTATTGTVINMVGIPGFQYSGTGGWQVSADGSAKTIGMGSTTFPTILSNLPNLTITGTGPATGLAITTGSGFNKLDFGVCAYTQPAATYSVGSLVLSPNGTFTALQLRTVKDGTINTNGKSINTFTIANNSTTTTLLSNVTCNSLELTQGTLNLNGRSLTTPAFSSISLAGVYRAIVGPGNLNCTGSGATAFAVTEGGAFFGGGYTINMTSATAKTFAGGSNGKYGTLNQAGAGDLTITGSNEFDNILATQTPSTILVAAGTTQKVRDFSLSGSPSGLVTFNSATPGSRFKLFKTSGTVSTTYLNIRDCDATGGAGWRTNSATSVNGGNNLGWIFAAIAAVLGQFLAFF